MTMQEPDVEPRRRTLMAAERTWLAWWRTALGTAVAAIGVGAALPKAVDSDHGWAYAGLGLGYAALSVALFAAGAIRQRRGEDALMRGSYHHLDSRTVAGFSCAGILLATVTAALLIADV